MGAYDAVVLAGGRARRLGGVDKPGLPVAGRTLLVRVLAAVPAAAQLIVVGPQQDVDRTVRWVREDPPGSGPVPALRAGLELVTAEQAVLLAADLPFLRPEHVHRLLDTLDRPTDGAVLVDDTGAEQWLLGAWWPGPLRRALADYTGSSLRGLLRPLRPASVAVPVPPGQSPPWWDCDCPDDLARARRWV